MTAREPWAAGPFSTAGKRGWREPTSMLCVVGRKCASRRQRTSGSGHTSTPGNARLACIPDAAGCRTFTPTCPASTTGAGTLPVDGHPAASQALRRGPSTERRNRSHPGGPAPRPGDGTAALMDVRCRAGCSRDSHSCGDRYGRRLGGVTTSRRAPRLTGGGSAKRDAAPHPVRARGGGTALLVRASLLVRPSMRLPIRSANKLFPYRHPRRNRGGCHRQQGHGGTGD